MAIYTKTGDLGNTNLRGGTSVSKSSLQICAIGEVDELNAALGIVRSENEDEVIGKILNILQKQLFDMGADLSSLEKGENKITVSHCEQLEKWIDQFEERLEKINNFVLPGGSKTASELHFSRAVCRRAERIIVSFSNSTDGNRCDCAEIIKYMNRLSDLLFVMARYANQTAGVPEIKWEGK
jgi:cob(I)alamin adenosyltransferase